MTRIIKIHRVNECIELIWYECNMHEEILYLNGKKHGKNRVWYVNNKICRCTIYIEGKRQQETEWYNSGELWTLKKYVNNVKHGEHKKWYKNGRLQKKISYINGQKQTSSEWFENGKQKHEIYYKNGYVDGNFKMWDESGNVIAIDYGESDTCCIIS